MHFDQHDARFAITLLAVAAGSVFVLNLIYVYVQSPADLVLVAQTPALEQIAQEESDDSEATEVENSLEDQVPQAASAASSDTANATAAQSDTANATAAQSDTANATAAQSANATFSDPEETPATPPQSSSNTSVTYTSGGGGGGGGSSSKDKSDDETNNDPKPDPDPDPKPDPDPDPKPDPDPDPKPDPDPDPKPDDPPRTKGLHGVNFIDPVLNRREYHPQLSERHGFVNEFVQVAKESQFNLFRIPVKWEGYVGNEANFLGELKYLVKTANENKISVWIDFHHFYATSKWGARVASGEGFPSFVVSCYKPTKSYERDPEVRAFWNDYYLNKVRDPNNSCRRTLDVWTLHADFMKEMIQEIDHYPNVLGYELLNEPHVWKDADYENLGNMHTELAKKLRKVTDKTLIFTREIPFGVDSDGDRYERQTHLQYKILPKDPDNNVIYAPHLYGLKNIESQVDNWNSLQKKWASMGYDVEIGVGEWASQPPEDSEDTVVTQEDINDFVKVWSREGYMHAYWAFACFRCGDGNVLVEKDGKLDDVGIFFKKSIIEYYEILS